MSLVEIVHAGIIEQMGGIADTIESELKASCPKRSGEARRAIHQEQVSEFVIRIGGTNDHLFFADQGNNQKYSYFGGKRNRLAPNHSGRGSRALHFTDGSWHTYAHTYEGKHFVKDVADRHR